MVRVGTAPIELFLSAGEASGDLHGAALVQALREAHPGVQVTCMGGPRLAASGAAVLVDNRDLAVVGLFEVLRHARTILAAWRTIRDHLARTRPAAVILIDYPDFNFLLARLAKRLGIKVFYYISPQVWAWRSGRVRTLRRLVDRMAVILPFEPAFFAAHRLAVDYVGHPLLDQLKDALSQEEACRRYRPPCAGAVVGLLPGSRSGEIRSLLPVLLESAELLSRELSGVRFLLPLAPTVDRAAIERQVDQSGLPVGLVSGDTYGVIRACDLLLAASGTVTLEAAILGTPMVIIYKVSPLTYLAGRHLIRVAFAGLPNLIAGRAIVPELLQGEAVPEMIAARARALLRSPEALEAQRCELSAIRSRLGEPGVAERVARLVLEMVEKSQ